MASSCSSTASSETSSRRTYFQQTYHKNSARVMEGEEEGENEIIVATAITAEDVNSGKTSYLSHQDTMADTPEISESSAGLDENGAAALNFQESDEESVEQATIDNLYRGDASGVVVAAVVQRRPSLLANLNRNSTSGGIQIVTPSPAGVGGGGGGVTAKQTSSPPTNNDDTSSATLSTEKQPPPPLRTLPVIMVRRSRLDTAVLENAWIIASNT